MRQIGVTHTSDSTPVDEPRQASKPGSVRLLSIIVLLGLALFLIRATGLPVIVQNEWRVSAYALDVLQNGHVFCQTDSSGDLASKPPLLTWLVSLFALITGRVDLFELHLPVALATIATALIILHAGRTYFDWRAGFLGAFSYLACSVGFNEMATARYDGLLALPVTLGALAAYRTWETGRGWTWFWIWGAVGTLVKGPIALLLAGGGLLAVWWAKRSGEPHPFHGGKWLGPTVFLLLTAGWFALAYHEDGPVVFDKMLRREFLGHAAGINEKSSPFAGLPMPSLAFLMGYAPWSIAAVIAFWRVFKKPANDPAERRFERFVLCWFVVGLFVFSVAAHQRGRLIAPLFPAAALLAGRELAYWTRRWPAIRTLQIVEVTGCVVVAAALLYSYVLFPNAYRGQRAQAMRNLAQQLEKFGAGQFPLTYVSDPVSLQVMLQTRRQEVSAQTAATLFGGHSAAFVVAEDADTLRKWLPASEPVFEVFRWPQNGKCEMRIISNYPRLEWPEHTTWLVDGLRLETDSAHLLGTRSDELSFQIDSAASAIIISNACPQLRTVKLRCVNKADGASSIEEHVLAPGAVWSKHFHHS